VGLETPATAITVFGLDLKTGDPRGGSPDWEPARAQDAGLATRRFFRRVRGAGARMHSARRSRERGARRDVVAWVSRVGREQGARGTAGINWVTDS
jgi:hypothetical protein